MNWTISSPLCSINTGRDLGISNPIIFPVVIPLPKQEEAWTLNPGSVYSDRD